MDDAVAVVQHRAERGRQAAEQAMLALQARQRMRGRQAAAHLPQGDQLVVGDDRAGVTRGAGAGRASGRGLQRTGDAVGHRLPRELARLHAAALDQAGAFIGALHALQQLEGLRFLVGAELDVEHGVAAHFRQRRRVGRDHRALAGHRLEHRQAEAFIP